MKQAKVEIKMGDSYKLGMNEVVGLREAMASVFKPVQTALLEHVYWNGCEMESVEYKSRDGFIANKHNCGGLAIDLIIPSCEQHDFNLLEFGECDDCGGDGEYCCAEKGGECISESEGHLDARLRIWFKFEGINEDGELEFYINASGGNNDAPYFRNTPDLFEASFTAKSLAGIARAASKHMKQLTKLIQE